jgi:hypothetical protein
MKDRKVKQILFNGGNKWEGGGQTEGVKVRINIIDIFCIHIQK